jgi:hypothetical protein
MAYRCNVSFLSQVHLMLAAPLNAVRTSGKEDRGKIQSSRKKVSDATSQG